MGQHLVLVGLGILVGLAVGGTSVEVGGGTGVSLGGISVGGTCVGTGVGGTFVGGTGVGIGVGGTLVGGGTFVGFGVADALSDPLSFVLVGSSPLPAPETVGVGVGVGMISNIQK